MADETNDDNAVNWQMEQELAHDFAGRMDLTKAKRAPTLSEVWNLAEDLNDTLQSLVMRGALSTSLDIQAAKAVIMGQRAEVLELQDQLRNSVTVDDVEPPALALVTSR